MTTEPKWKIEKTRILQLPIEEKRKLYKASYITLNQVEPWYTFAKENKSSLEDKKPNNEDLTEFRKLKIDPEQNKTLAEKVSIFQGDITKLEVSSKIVTICVPITSLLRIAKTIVGYVIIYC